MPVIPTTSNLQRIEIEVRRITRSPDENLLTTNQLEDYINTFYLYDMPANLRLFNLRDVFTFYTIPNVDTYASQEFNVNDDLYDFANQITAIHNPIFVGGIPAFFTQYRNEFYSNWPITNFNQSTGYAGNGTTGPFTGTLTAYPILQNNVMFSILDTTGQPMVLVDYPQNTSTSPNVPVNASTNRTTGILSLQGQKTITSLNTYGTINYLTGAYTITNFPLATQNSQSNILYSNTIPYQAAKPISMLYYDDVFVLRPVPDNVYAVTLEADILPTQLLSTSQSPELNFWWQYIALGTCLKVFRARMDMDSYTKLYPDYQKAEDMVDRRSVQQQCNMRTQTIFTQGKFFDNGGWWSFGSQGWPY